MNTLLSCLVYLVVSIWTITADVLPGGDFQTDASTLELLKVGPHGSEFYQVNGIDNYNDPINLLNLNADTSYNQGWDYASLVGESAIENWDNVLKSLLGDFYSPITVHIVNKHLDGQWNNYMSKDVPKMYMDELQGMSDASKVLSADVGKIASRVIVVANFPSDLEDLKYVYKDEKVNPPNVEEQERLVWNILTKKWKSFHCSNFGAWGSRTVDGRLFTARNLDWLTDLGLQKYKLITIHHPPDGYSHATFSWAGVWGAMTGMSAQGLTVHEANLESDDITFQGFPWMLRLREVMATARTINEAMTVWNSTQNTVGFNHGIGSAVDGSAVLLETMMHSTAVFSDNDPREATYIYNGENIGRPRKDAIFRTNHGYDPYSISHFQWNGTNAMQYSVERYYMFADTFDYYESADVLMDVAEAVNITALVGDKGEATMTSCVPPYDDAGNILSVVYDPSKIEVYAAWENGHRSDQSWSPAACNTYVKLNLKDLFGAA